MSSTITQFINGKAVLWIADIRNAPGGDRFLRGNNNEIKESNLHVCINAVATDQFTLYLENGSLEGNYPTLIGEIHLDASNRKEGEKPTWRIVKFHLPFDKRLYINLTKALLPANECPLELPNIFCTTSAVMERQKKRKS